MSSAVCPGSGGSNSSHALKNHGTNLSTPAAADSELAKNDERDDDDDDDDDESDDEDFSTAALGSQEKLLADLGVAQDKICGAEETLRNAQKEVYTMLFEKRDESNDHSMPSSLTPPSMSEDQKKRYEATIEELQAKAAKAEAKAEAKAAKAEETIKKLQAQIEMQNLNAIPQLEADSVSIS